MPITTFIDHLVFRVSALEETERFYTALLSQSPERAEDSVMYQLGQTLLFFTTASGSQTEPHDKERIGLNHIAFGVRTLKELESIEAHLNRCQIAHSGIALDRYGHREFIWLDDPNGIRLEFYLRTE